MLEPKDWFTLIIALAGVVTSTLVAYLAFSLNKQSEKAQTQREIGESYDRLIAFRTQHPEVFFLSRKWTNACFESLYAPPGPETTKWINYYIYVELCISFINAVIANQKSGLLDSSVYKSQYFPLVKLLLTENYPILKDLVHSGKYLSHFIPAVMADLEKQGWNWTLMYEQLAKS